MFGEQPALSHEDVVVHEQRPMSCLRPKPAVAVPS